MNSVTQIYANCLELNEFLDTLSSLNKIVDSLLLIEYDEIRNIIWKKNVTIIPKKYVSSYSKCIKAKNIMILVTSYKMIYGVLRFIK